MDANANFISLGDAGHSAAFDDNVEGVNKIESLEGKTKGWWILILRGCYWR